MKKAIKYDSYYDKYYDEFNKFCHVCNLQNRVFSMGGGRIQFSCPSQKSEHLFQIIEDHFVSYKENKVSLITIRIKDFDLEFNYFNNASTNFKTVQSDYIKYNGIKYPKLEYNRNLISLDQLSNLKIKLDKLKAFF